MKKSQIILKLIQDIFSHQFFTELVSSFLGNAERGLAVLVLQTRVGSGPEEEPHALALVLDDAVVQGGVALAGLLVKAARVLDDEVDHVQGVARLVGDGVVKTSFSEFLEKYIY